MTKILAIETSCDDTSASIVKDGNEILSLVTNSQITEHNKFGGVFPEIASRMHCKNISKVVQEAILKAKINKNEIDAIAVTYKPGLVGSLLVGINFAKGFSFGQKIPIIPVNHLKGHVASLYINNPNLKPPFLCLLVSGGHTCILEIESYTSFKILAKTLDDAAGECMDKIARALGLDYPGGKNLDKFAEYGNELRFHFKTPKLINENFSFSGLKTSAKNLIQTFEKNNENIPIQDICASVRRHVAEYLSTTVIKIAKKLQSKNFEPMKIAISGGVSANSMLRKKLQEQCINNGFKFFKPDLKFCGDNAAMIGVQGYFEFCKGNIGNFSLNAQSHI